MKIWTGSILVLSGILLIWPINTYVGITVGILAVTLGSWTLFGK